MSVAEQSVGNREGPLMPELHQGAHVDEEALDACLPQQQQRLWSLVGKKERRQLSIISAITLACRIRFE